MSNPASLQLSRQDDPRSQAGTGFDQGGTTDWVALSNTVFKFSFDVLSRLSQAGVEALTLQASLFMFRNVHISPEGERRIENAVDKLGANPSYTKALWFGFGYRHIIHEIRKTREGLSCIAICAALAEMYGPLFSSQVLKELFLLQGPPPDMTPALRQWSAIIDVCAGVLANTEFSSILHQWSKIYLHEGNRLKLRPPTQPKRIANTLSGLFAVADNKLDSLQISGGADCAWLAAVAHWILGLSVEIHDINGDVIYRPGNPDLGASIAQQAQIIIHQNMEIETPAQITRSLHFIPPGQQFLIPYSDLSHSAEALSYGRPPWETCLVDSFGPRMRVLLENHGDLLGRCLGASSRIFASRRGEPDPILQDPAHLDRQSTPMIDPDDDLIPIGPASSTVGFYSAARDLLPELGRSRLIMTSLKYSSTLSVEAARQEYNDSVKSLCRICDCDPCHYCFGPDPAGSGPREIGSTHLNDCLLALGNVTRKLVHMFSNCFNHSEERLRPTTAGMLVHLKLYEARAMKDLRRAIRSVAAGRRGTEDSFSILESNTPRPRLSLLYRICLIFGGRDIRETDDGQAVAWSKTGLVAYHETLSEISSDPKRIGSIRIMAGAIEWQKMRYTTISSAKQEQMHLNGAATPNARTVNDLSSFAVPGISSKGLTAHLILEEKPSEITFNTLLAYYAIRLSNDTSSRLSVDPLQIIGGVWGATSLQGRCTGLSTSCQSIQGREGTVVEGEGDIDLSGLPSSDFSPIVRVLPPSSLAVWAALTYSALSPVPDGQGHVCLVKVIQTTECLGCCFSRAMVKACDEHNNDRRVKKDQRVSLDAHGDYAQMSSKLGVRLICLACPKEVNYLAGP